MKKIIVLCFIFLCTYTLLADEPTEEQPQKFTLEQAHKIFAVDFFNNTWDFLDNRKEHLKKMR